jgi:3-hydroxybutyryl-CoA dehydratase
LGETQNLGRNPTWGVTPYFIEVTLTKEMIQNFARAIGDMNPLYFDEDYAKKFAYGGLIAPPSIHVMLMMICTPHDDWMKEPGTINAGQSWYYDVPARPGNRIRLACKALKKEETFDALEWPR